MEHEEDSGRSGMSAAQHTPEKLAQHGHSIHVADYGPAIADAYDTEIARRFVACWNACQGLSTESLERLGTLDRARVELDVFRAQAIAQRNELLDELRVARSALADFAGLTEPHAHALARRFAETIAKATGAVSLPA